MKGKRNLLIGFVFGALLAGGVSFLYMNKLFKAQQQYQQIQIDQQSALIDSIRQSGMASLLNNLLNKIDDELKHNPRRVLTDETIAQITTVSYSCKPYTSPENDSLSGRKLSPERGHLLLALSRMNIDSGCMQKIIHQSVFAGADLRKADLKGMDLGGAVLQGADLRDARLEGTNFSKADLRSALLWGADMNKANLTEADLTSADLRWANLNNADLQKTILNKADLSSAQLRKADLRNASLDHADLSGAFLIETNMAGANLLSINLHRANLESANLSRTNLKLALITEANLTKTILTEATMTLAVVTGAVVTDEHWLSLLSEWNVTGANEIRSQYKLVADCVEQLKQYRLEKNK